LSGDRSHPEFTWVAAVARTERSHVLTLKRTSTAALALAISASLGACGADEATSPEESNGQTAVTVSLIPTASFFPIYVAQEEGFFEEEGLTVDVQVASNAAAVVPSVLNGQIQFGTAATPPFLVAYAKGLPVRAVVNAAGVAATDEEDTGAFVVPVDSSLQSIEELPGMTVATNQLGSSPHVAAVAALSDAGVEPDQVNFVPMPFPDMRGALEQGQVDAVLYVEPFMTEVLEAGVGRSISPLYTPAYAAGATNTLVFTSQDYIEENPDVVAAFARAVSKANALVAEDPQVLRDALVEYGDMSEDLAAAVYLGDYREGFEVEGMQEMADQMVEDGFLEAPVDVPGAIWDGE
jgi:NitT/TauT family transport system substrate-binding protein